MTDKKVILELIASGLVNTSELSRRLKCGDSEAKRKYLSRRLKRSTLSKENIRGIVQILDEHNLQIKTQQK